MSTKPPSGDTGGRCWKAALVVLLGALLFALAYTQAPLFYSNQNQYFLHGMAEAGEGFLDHDWLARETADPTPAFSAIVAFTHRYLDDRFFYVYFALFIAAYALALWGLFGLITGRRLLSPPGLAFFALLTLLHSGALRLASALVFGKDYPWYFQAGVANQYILGFGLQPSVAGVLLVVSIVLFVWQRPWLAIVALALASILHSTYLLAGAYLTIAYMAVLLRERGWRAAVVAGLFALALVSPVLIYNWIHFAPTSASDFEAAQHIVSQYRIPHHTLVERWLDWIAGVQIAWIAFGIVLVRGTRLALTLSIAAGLALALSVVQVATRSDTLALLFPWRISAVLVPIATVVVLARLAQVLTSRLNVAGSRGGSAAKWACVAIVVGLALGGSAIEWWRLAYRMPEEELPLYEFVRAHAGPEDVYLLPVKEPSPGKVGSESTSFLSPPRMNKATPHIPVDLQRFRLFTGAPVYVDFKAIPYRDVDVLEWKRRLQRAVECYRTHRFDEVATYGITHVILQTTDALPANSSGLGDLAYQDTFYRVYRVR